MTEHERTGELLEAVDALTRPVVEHVKQHDDDGAWLRTHTVALPPLLSQLVAAIRSSTSGKAGGGNPATRALLNSDALYQSMRITSAVTDWCNIAKVRPTREPVRDLRAWFVAYTQTEHDPAWHVTELRKWAGTIRTLLDPPRRFELTEACPTCKATSFVNTDGEVVPYPLTVEYRDADAALSTARVVCRACDEAWSGLWAIRSVSHELEATNQPNRSE